MRKVFIRGLFVLALFSSFGLFDLPAQTDSTLTAAPVNPEFLQAMGSTGTVKKFQGLEALGHIPGPVDLSYFVGIQDERIRAGYPAAYDLRSYGKITPVKNQGGCGSCWSFGAFGSLESSLLPAENRDFGELHLIRYHGFDWTECAGGNTFISEAYLARWGGPRDEADFPYIYSAIGSPLAPAPSAQKHVQTVVWLPKRISSTDNETIKYFLTNYGAVTFAFYWDGAYYSSAAKSYCCPAAHASNHEVCFVGWDDNFDRYNFSSVPAGNGAFLCKNSWGTGWGNAGYFWLSYYDATIGDMAMFFDAQPVSNYQNIYQYDPLGWVTSFGFGATSAWEANIFTSVTNDPLRAIAYVTTDRCSVAYSIYKNPTAGNPTSGTLVASGDAWATNYPGYYTYPLPSPVTLAAGDSFSVVLHYVNYSFTYPMAVESYWAGYSSAATNAAGQSFYSSSGTSWSDWYDYSGNAFKINGCIKAFTRPAAMIPTVTTKTPTSITSTSAASGGNVTSDGGAAVTARGVCWGLSINPTTADNKTIDGNGTGDFTSSISGLSPGTSYHVRAYATNSAGTAYGGDLGFPTAPITQTITVLSPNGGESWQIGTLHAIIWTSAGVAGNVKIESSATGGASWTTEVDSTANDGSYAWTIPNTLSSACLVRVSAVSDTGINDTSDAFFSIVNELGIVTSYRIPFASLDNGNVNIGNIGSQLANLNIKVFNTSGGQLFEQYATIPANGVRRTWDLLGNIYQYAAHSSIQISGDRQLVGDNIKWASPPYDTLGAGFTCGPVSLMKGKEFDFPFNSSIDPTEWANAYCVITNVSPQPAYVTIEIFDQYGASKTKTDAFQVPAGGLVRSWDKVGSIQAWADPALIKVTSDQDVVVEAVRWAMNKRGWGFAIFPSSIGSGTSFVVPFGSLDNGNINIANVGTATANVIMQVRGTIGEMLSTSSITIPAKGVKRTWDLIGNIYNYAKHASVQITSDQPLVGDNIKWASPPYPTLGAGFTCGPLSLMKGKQFAFPFNSSVNATEWANGYCVIVNTASTMANVTIDVYDQNGTLKKTASLTVPAYGLARSWDSVGSIQAQADPALLKIASDQDVVVEAVRWVQNRRGWGFAILPAVF